MEYHEDQQDSIDTIVTEILLLEQILLGQFCSYRFHTLSWSVEQSQMPLKHGYLEM